MRRQKGVRLKMNEINLLIKKEKLKKEGVFN